MHKIIDCHNHLWRYSATEFSWITEKLSKIRRNFLIDDLINVLSTHHVSGSLLVQALPSVEETNWLLTIANQHPLVKGVIGWCDVSQGKQIANDIENFKTLSPKLKGIRYMSQGLPAEHMLTDAFIEGVRTMGEYGLVYELLITWSQLKGAKKLIDACPEVNFIIEHIAKPNIKEHNTDPWIDDITAIATQCPNVSCKLSGMVTEAGWDNWTYEDFKPYLETLFNQFGHKRLVFGSDWPVHLLAANYGQILQLLNTFLSDYSEQIQEDIFFNNACQLYGLTIRN